MLKSPFKKSLRLHICCIVQSIDTARLEGKGQPKFTAGRWNPHHSGSQIATANDTTIKGWDVRTMRLGHLVYYLSLSVALGNMKVCFSSTAQQT